MEKRFLWIAAGIILLGAVAGGLFGRIASTAATDQITEKRILTDYSEALGVVESNYVGEIDREKLTESSTQGLLWTLDPHSGFFTAAEFKKLSEEQSSRFFGIGVSILQHRDGVYVQSVVPGTPAEKAGLRYGDRIVQVDGKDATEWSSAEVSRNVRGPRSTEVKVTVERASAEKPVEFDLQRDGVPLPSIRNSFMLPNGVGYVGMVGGFQETTSAELDEALADLQKQGMKSLILDLRGNPGGLLPQAVGVVSRFIGGGQTAVSVRGRSQYAVTEELRTTSGVTHDMPLVVMLNGGSASASEIVAGAIQDYDRGLVVGTDSFGKGLVQRVFPLPYGAGLTLTTARYYTPLGRSLQRDYSNGSIYDYYSHADEEAGILPPLGQPVTSPGGRTLYGGRGIEPDVDAKLPEGNAARSRVNEAAFFFVRELVAGKVAGFENMKTEKQDQRTNIPAEGISVSDRLFEAFRSFATSESENFGLTAENLRLVGGDYSRNRIREELATAIHSSEAGFQALIESDPQILKARAVMPDAKQISGRIAFSADSRG